MTTIQKLAQNSHDGGKGAGWKLMRAARSNVIEVGDGTLIKFENGVQVRSERYSPTDDPSDPDCVNRKIYVTINTEELTGRDVNLDGCPAMTVFVNDGDPVYDRAVEADLDGRRVRLWRVDSKKYNMEGFGKSGDHDGTIDSSAAPSLGWSEDEVIVRFDEVGLSGHQKIRRIKKVDLTALPEPTPDEAVVEAEYDPPGDVRYVYAELHELRCETGETVEAAFERVHGPHSPDTLIFSTSPLTCPKKRVIDPDFDIDVKIAVPSMQARPALLPTSDYDGGEQIVPVPEISGTPLWLAQAQRIADDLRMAEGPDVEPERVDSSVLRQHANALLDIANLIEENR